MGLLSWFKRIFKGGKMDPQLTVEQKMKALRSALEGVFAPALHLDAEKLYLFAKLSPPVGRHLHAWTYPADAFLEGPGGSIAIAFRQESLERMSLRMLMLILAHESAHATVHMDQIRLGQRVDESQAENIAKELMRLYGAAIEGIVKEAEDGA